MATKTLQTRFVLKNDTEALWNSNDPILMKGEIGIANDVNKIKIGDGTSKWSELNYVGLSEEEIGTLVENASDNVYIATATDKQTDIEAIDDVVGEATLKKADMAIVKREIVSTDGVSKTSCTSYVYGASGWEAMDGNYSADNVFLASDITMAGNYSQVGNLTKTQNGTATFPTKGLSVAEALQKIFTKTLQPSITGNPAVSISAPNNKAYEVGETVTPTYSCSLSAGSYTYGPATGITASAWEVKDNLSTPNTATTATGSFPAITVTDNTNYKITATATHGEGAVAKDNVGGQSNPVVKIASGTKSNTSAAITGYRKWWTYVGTDMSTIDSAFIRAKGTNKGAAGSNFNVDLAIPAGTTRVFIAIPQSKNKTLSEVIDVDGMGLNVKDNFTKTQVDVEGAVAMIGETSTKMSYDIFVCENTAGLKATTYKVKF